MTDSEQIAILEAEVQTHDNYLQKVWLPRMMYLGKTIHQLKTKISNDTNSRITSGQPDQL